MISSRTSSLFLVGLVLVVAIPAVGASPPPGSDNPWLSRRIVALAHAGGEDENPQETLYAFKRASQAGVQVLDMDVQITSDGVPIVMHDDSVDRTTNGTGTVYSKTFAQVHALDAAYWYTDDCAACHGRPAGDYPYRGIRNGSKPPPTGFTADDFAVPSLEEVFEAFPDAYFDIEIKDDAGDVTTLANKVAALIHDHDLSKHVVIASFGGPGMSAFRAAAPDVATSATLDEVQDFFLSGTVPEDAQILDVPPFYDLGGTTITVVSPDFVKRAHQAGLAVWVWMDSGDEQNATFYAKLLDMGVDGLNVSRPKVLMELLAQRGGAWNPNAVDVPPVLTPSSTTGPESDRGAPPAVPRQSEPTYTG